MQLVIHRGTNVIGGTCIEIKSSNCRIILDAGLPLMDKAGREIDEGKLEHPSIENGILSDIDGLYKNQDPDIDAALISHAHLDHYGLLDHIHFFCLAIFLGLAFETSYFLIYKHRLL